MFVATGIIGLNSNILTILEGDNDGRCDYGAEARKDREHTKGFKGLVHGQSLGCVTRCTSLLLIGM